MVTSTNICWFKASSIICPLTSAEAAIRQQTSKQHYITAASCTDNIQLQTAAQLPHDESPQPETGPSCDRGEGVAGASCNQESEIKSRLKGHRLWHGGGFPSRRFVVHILWRLCNEKASCVFVFTSTRWERRGYLQLFPMETFVLYDLSSMKLCKPTSARGAARRRRSFEFHSWETTTNAVNSVIARKTTVSSYRKLLDIKGSEWIMFCTL